MKMPSQYLANPSAIAALGISLFALSTSQIGAVNDPSSPTSCPGQTQTCTDCNGNSFQQPSTQQCPNSFNMGISVGLASIQRTNGFLSYSRGGILEGQAGKGSYRNFDQLRKTVLNSSNLIDKEMQNISAVHPQIDSALYSPAIFSYIPLNGTEYIESEGELKQVKTDTAFTDIEKIDGGFIVRVWNIVELTNTTKTGNLYTPPAAEKAINIVTFKNPDFPAENNRLVVTQEENFSGTTAYKITRLYDQTNKDNYSVTTYAGAEATGNPIERLTLSYSNRGSRPWDYTVERKHEQATQVGGIVDSTLKVVTHDRDVYEDHSLSEAGGDRNGKRLLSRTIAVGTAQEQTTSYDYYVEVSNPFIHGRLKSSQAPDGSWEYWEYLDSEGSPVAIETKYSSWKDIPIGSYQQARKEETTIHGNEALRVVSINGEIVEKESFTTETDEESGRLLSVEEKWTGSEWSRQETIYEAAGVDNAAKGRPIAITYSDGTAKKVEYSEADGQTTITEYKGEASSLENTEFTIVDGYKTVTVYNESYAKVSEEVYDIESGLLLSSMLSTEFNASGRPTKTIYNSNPDDYMISQYGCCGLEYSRDRSGATTTYYRDTLKRVYRTVTQRSTNGEAITTNTDFDGLTTKVTRTSSAGTLLVSETTRTLGGLTTTTKSPDADGDGQPETVTRTIVHNTGTGSTTTNVSPDGATTITATFLDGKAKATSGTAVTGSDTVSMTYDYGTHALNGGGIYTQMIQPNGTQSIKSFRDQLGRNFRSENSDGSHSETSYFPQTAAAGSRGKMASSTDADETTLAGSGSLVSYGYNGRGERISTTTQLSNNQQMVTTTEHDEVDDADIGISHRYRTWVNGVLTNTSLRSGDGYRSKSITLAGTTTSERTVPVDGAWTVTSTAANGAYSIQSYTDGLMKQSATYAAGSATALTSNSATHDAFGRVLTQTDARTGTMTYGAYNENGSIQSMTDAGGRTTSYTYDNMGRTVTVDAPDTTDKDGNTINNITHTSYNLTGTVAGTWGDQTYARFNVYDSQNRLVELRTYQDLAHGTEPTFTTAGFAKTNWNYDAQRGWLNNKRYDDNKGTDYTYTAAGRLKTRTWSRGIVTTYSYDQGQMVSTDYSDSTPDVVYTYDSFGRPTLVTQAEGIINGSNVTLANQHAYIYDAATLVLDKEVISYGNGLSRTLDRSQDNLLRPSGFQLMNGTTEEHATSYGYDTAGRLAGVHSASVYSATPDFSYNYLVNSGSLVESVTGPAHTVSNSYETTRNVLDVKSNATNGDNPSVVSAFDYSVNNLGQRDDVSRTGSAFTSANTETWNYNAKGEVVTADHSTKNEFDRSFEFDGIGNRKKSADSITLPATDNHVANTLNQLTNVNDGAKIHDADGNLTDNGTHLYEWDAENRLIEIKLKSDNSIIATYAYDYQSRRITKIVGSTETNFVYNAWNPIAEFTGTTLSKTYTWGMDLSGSMQGAGGVGGLLSVNDGSATYYPTFDGNGNVSEYVDATGAVVAHYEYDAFGQVVASGTKANDFTHQFSTKPLDSESGLHYYGYRCYDSSNGRWLGRDPIEEEGGVNLYGFVGNNGVNFIDLLGLLDADEECIVEIDIAHGFDWDNFDRQNARYLPIEELIKKDSKVFNNIHPTSRKGVIGCCLGMDASNLHLQRNGIGIPRMPRNLGELVGMASEPINGVFPGGAVGWNQFVNAAWMAGLEEANNMCNGCCKEKGSITIRVICSENRGRISESLKNAEYERGKKWCGRQQVVTCP